MWTTNDLAVIETAIASGQLSVEYQDQKITYRSMTDLLKAKSIIEQYLNQSNPSFATRQIRFSPKSGF